MTDAVKRFFQDENGRYVIAQWPNLPICLAIASSLLTRLDLGTNAHRLLEYTSFGAIFLWSYLEITDGDSPFRRVLGASVMAWLLGTTAAAAS